MMSLLLLMMIAVYLAASHLNDAVHDRQQPVSCNIDQRQCHALSADATRNTSLVVIQIAT